MGVLKSVRRVSLLQVIIGVIIILVITAVSLYVYKPFEKAKLSRDQKRIQDLDRLNAAVEAYLKNNSKTGPTMCDGCQIGEAVFATGLIDLDRSFTLKVATSSAVNITGWVPVDFSLNSKIGKTPIKKLPMDPINTDPYVYTYTPGKKGAYKLTAALESLQNDVLESDDGGTDESRYEVGTDLTLPP